ncbi:unnamed protein product, partial [Ectocarpus sp. 6 AP-2014]
IVCQNLGNLLLCQLKDLLSSHLVNELYAERSRILIMFILRVQSMLISRFELSLMYSLTISMNPSKSSFVASFPWVAIILLRYSDASTRNWNDWAVHQVGGKTDVRNRKRNTCFDACKLLQELGGGSEWPPSVYGKRTF